MLETQMQMRVPAEEREQDTNNKKFKIKLQKIVDLELKIAFGDIEKTYEEIVDYCINYKTIEEKSIPTEIQAKILSGVELTPDEIALLQNN